MPCELIKGPHGGLGGGQAADDPGGDLPGRRRRPLTSADRAVIAVGLAEKWSHARIGAVIGRDRSVIKRDVERHRAPDGSYHPAIAHRRAHEARKRPKAFKLAAHRQLCAQIEGWMDQGWSPELIARVLRQDHPHDSMERVSHETIYQALYVQARGALRADLYRQLSLKRRARQRRQGRTRGGANTYGEAFKISQRPAEVADRAVPGHWEGDLIIGAGGRSAVGTLVERTTRFTMLLHLPDGRDAESVAAAMIREMGRLPEQLLRSVTWDRGNELAQYREIQLALGTTLYFADPHSPWQRGTNENTNRLLRFWLTKGSDLSVHTAEDLRQIAATLNQRPRPTLDLQTPAQRLNQLLQDAA